MLPVGKSASSRRDQQLFREIFRSPAVVTRLLAH